MGFFNKKKGKEQSWSKPEGTAEPEKSRQPEVLVESRSPLCDIQAFAEENDTCVYFYLWWRPGSDRAQVKSCWVCNTKPAPDDPDKAAMDRGEAPRMPRSGCGHDPAGIRLDKKALSILWLEEGDAAALLENGKILALIPGWAWREERFPGYARYAVGTTPFAWTLKDAEAALAPRVEKSRAYWEAMEDYWKELQESRLAALEAFFGGPHEQYYAIDGGKFPAKALVTGRRDGVRYGFTLGVSALCQPVVEQYWSQDPASHRRIELAFAAREGIPEDRWMAALGRISGMTNLPWGEITCLGQGHTVACGETFPGFPAVLLLDQRRLEGTATPDFAPVMGEPVTLLWAVPITQAEYDLAMESQEAILPVLYQGRPEELVVFAGEGKFLRDK